MITAFVQGRVFVGDGNVIENGTVLVDDKRILKVSEGEIPIPENARRVSLDGCTLLPGFIDCHVHLCLDASPDIVKSMQAPDAMIALRASKFAEQTLMAGITCVRDMGGKNGIDFSVRNAIHSGVIKGPRMLASGRMITMTGGQGWDFGAREADGPEEVRKAVREQLKAGADVAKFMATGGVLTPGVEPGSVQLSEEELRAGIQEAHKAGRKTAAHAEGTQGILNALRAGTDTIEHAIGLNQEAVSLMLENNVALIGTLSAIFNIETHGLGEGIPAFAVEKAKRIKDVHLMSMRRALEAGIQVVMGTDAGCPCNFHGGNLLELELLQGVGFSSMDVLRSATHTAAQVLGLDTDLGSVEEGKLADLVVVEGNPLQDITVLQRPEAIRWVIKGGESFKCPD